MILRVTAISILIVPVLLAADAELLPKDDFIRQWEISKQFTLEVAAKMPAEHYTFKPTQEQMTFGAQLVHIAASLEYRFTELRGQKPDLAHLKQIKTKEEVIAAVTKAYDFTIATVRTITPEQLNRKFKVDWVGRPESDGRNMMMNMLVHAAHHRAQIEVYLRLKGIAPPAYTF
jgi:uncharacterized damage-inducible protein DinB